LLSLSKFIAIQVRSGAQSGASCSTEILDAPMPLTDVLIKKSTPRDKPYRITDGNGMYLEVMPNGSKYFRLKYRFARKEKRLALGVYPTTLLAQAREKSDAARRLLANGVDPGEHRKAKKLALAKSIENSFEVVATEWLKQFSSKWTASHKFRLLRRIEQHLLPFIGKKSISAITAPELLQVPRKIEARGTLETAHRVLQICEQIFRYAIATGRAEQNPAACLKGALAPAKVRHRAAIIDPNELAEALVKLEIYQGTPQVKAALLLLPHLFGRPGELRHMKWSEVNFETAEWHHRLSKTDTEQITPLSRQVLEILKELQPFTQRSDYVFPSTRTVNKPISENTMNSALRTLGIDRAKLTAHGFRATARTLLDQDLKFRPDIIEQQLGHAVRDPNGRSYNRTTHLPDKKLMMQSWSDYLDKIKAQKILRIKAANFIDEITVV